MSAPNQGRQSPPPEQAPHAVEKTADAKVGAAPSEEHAKESSEETKESVLESNPVGPLEDAAQAKVSKEGRGPGI